MEEHFDVSRIIGIKIVDKRKTSHKWLPRKQKTTFFGLIKRDAYHSEGYYSNGHYQECYESGCWDACSTTRESLILYGYLIPDPRDCEETEVFYKPYATVYLEHECQVQKAFDSYEEALEWAEELKKKSGKTFEIVKK